MNLHTPMGNDSNFQRTYSDSLHSIYPKSFAFMAITLPFIGMIDVTVSALKIRVLPHRGVQVLRAPDYYRF